MPTTPPPPSTAEQTLQHITTTLSSLLTTTTHTYTAYILPILPSPLQNISLTLSSILSPLLTASDGSIDIVSLASLLLILYLSLRILDFVRQSIVSWIKFFVKIGMVLLVVQGVVYVRSYGWEKALRDAGWVGGIVWGWAEEAFEGAGMGEGGNQYGYGSGSRAAGNGKGWNVSGGRQHAQGRRKGGSWS